MSLSWVSVEARTGAVITDLPDLTVDVVRAVLGEYSSATANLPLPTAPSNWRRATLEGGARMVLLDDADDGSAPVPIWGGTVIKATPSGRSDQVPLSLATFEAYLGQRFVGDMTFTGVDQCEIVASLITSFVMDGTVAMRVSYTASATTRDRTYTAASDKTVLAAIQELSAVIGGPEWTVEWESSVTAGGVMTYTPVVLVADRIGQPATAGMPSVPAVFEMPGCLIDAVLTRDYSTGKGANSVMAVSSGVGAARPESSPQVFADPDRPTVEFRFTPSTSITDVTTLVSHAQAGLAALEGGTQALTLVGDYFTSPRLGRVWFMGDDVGYRVGGLVDDPQVREVTTYSDVFPDTFTSTFGAAVGTTWVPVNPTGRDSVPAFPGGIDGVARAIGWEATLGMTPTITPILAQAVGF